MLTANDLNKLLPEFIAHLSSTNSSRSTAKNYASDIRRVFSRLAGFEYLQAEDFNSALKELSEEFSIATIRRFSFSLKSFLSWAESKGYTLKTASSIDEQAVAVPLQNVSEDINPGPLDSYVAHLQKEGSSKNTVSHYQRDVSSFLSWKSGQDDLSSVQEKDVNKINRNDIKRYTSFLRSRQFSDSSIQRYLSALKSFFSFHKEKVVFENNPVSSSGKKKGNLFGRVVGYRPRWWHSYRGHPISDYINWGGLTGLVLILGLNIYTNYFLPAPVDLKGAVLAAAAPPAVLSFQGRLTNNAGAPITTSTNIVFKIYDARTSGTLLWTSKTWALTPDSNGIFSACLGDQITTDDCLVNGVADTAFPSDLFTNNAALYLDITVGADTLTPRQRITSVAYAASAGSVNTSLSTATNNTDANTINLTNSNTSASTITVNGATITLNGTSNGNGGSKNVLNALNFASPLTPNSNVFYGLNFATGYTDILRYNGTQLISGTGVTGAGLTLALGSSTITGTLGLSNGGTNNNITASNGQVAYSDTTKILLTSGGSSGNCLTYNSGSAPTWAGCSGSTVPFNNVTAGTNTAALVIGTGGSLTTSGSGTITATDVACTDCIALTTETTGNYVASANTSALTGLTGGSAGSEGAALSLALDESQALSGNVDLAANTEVFGVNGIIFEGSTGGAGSNNETFIAVTDPTSDHTFTFPDVATGNICISNVACISTSGTAGTFTGNYVASVTTSVLTGLTGGNVAGNATNSALAFDYSQALSGDVGLGANAAVFGQNGLVFEGSSADTIETYIAVTNPTGSDHTFTFPDVASGNVCISGISCTATAFTEADTLQTVTARGATSDQAITLTKVNSAGSGAQVLTLQGTLAAFNGTDSFYGIFLNYTNASHTGSTNSVNGIELDLDAVSANATENAISINTNWDNLIKNTNFTVAASGAHTIVSPTTFATSGGTIFGQSFASSSTQGGALTGLSFDFSTNLTVPNSSSGTQTGLSLTLKDGGASAPTKGIYIRSDSLNSGITIEGGLTGTITEGVRVGSLFDNGDYGQTITTGYGYYLQGISSFGPAATGTDAYLASLTCTAASCGSATATLTNGLHVLSNGANSTVTNGINIESTNSGVVTNDIRLHQGAIITQTFTNATELSTTLSLGGASGIGQAGIFVGTNLGKFLGKTDGIYISTNITSASTINYGLEVANPTVSGSGAITSNYGLYVASQSRGSTDNFGLVIEGVSGGSGNNVGLCFDCDGTYSFTTTAAGIQWGTDNAASIFRAASNALTLSTSGNGAINLSPNGSGDVVLSQGAGSQLSLSASAATTVDQLVITNTGQGSTTDGIDAVSASIFTATGGGVTNSALHGIIGNAPVDASDIINGLNIDGIAQTVASATQNLALLTPATSGNTNGTLNGLKVASITTGGVAQENAIWLGSGWDASIAIAASGANAVKNFTIKNDASTQANLFEVRDIGFNCGSPTGGCMNGLALADAFISRQSYWNEEFNVIKSAAGTGCSDAAITTGVTTTFQRRGDQFPGPLTSGGAAITQCSAGSGELLTSSSSSGTNNGQKCDYFSNNALNSYESVKATGTSTRSATCLETNSTTTAQQTIFNTQNYPQMTMKVRPSAVGSSSQAVFAGLSTRGAVVDGGMAATDIGFYFSNCTNPTTAALACTTAGWQGFVSDGSATTAITSDRVSCAATTISTTNFSYLRIEVRQSTAASSKNIEVQFFVDYNTSDGISETSCGTITASSDNFAAASNNMSVLLQSYTANATAQSLDVDYARVWQDDTVSDVRPVNDLPSEPANAIELGTALESSQTSDQQTSPSENSSLVSSLPTATDSATTSARLSLDSLGNLIVNIPDGTKFLWNNSAGTAVGWVSDTGEALFSKLTSAIGDFGQLVFGELIAKKDAHVAGEASFETGATEMFISSDKIKEDSIINLTNESKTNGVGLYVKEKRAGEGFVVALERNSGDQPDEATASATTAIRFNWVIINQK